MRRRILAIPVILLLLVPVLAQQVDPSVLTVDSLFTYRTRPLGPVWWQANGSGLPGARAVADKEKLRRPRPLRRRDR